MDIPHRQELKPHTLLDEDSRYKKAKKIHAIINNFDEIKNNTFLEVGTGSGFIAAYFTNFFLEVNSVDVRDQRQTQKDIRFRQIDGTKLPFPDNYFDLVVSNHVIEHVGNRESQIEHLKEIFRVMKKEGIFYLAFPNKWRLIEPHYKLPLLSWFSSFYSDLYVRLSGKAEFYDCRPLSRSDALAILQSAGLNPHEVTLDAIRIYAKLESDNRFVKILASLPTLCFIPFKPWISTLIFVCRKDPRNSIQ
ncbi:class I SAM-dependent methyltransferase [Leptospira selangorensis]|uniref:Class I SAM-dependent methyltransferase n=1 Tax=Leptospira selangorensis TaxID=2484982 RepID=A0A5F2BZ75_9LEPT|nr:class I SAM-dependent methyltransferase [Leptospira selangorensis]TGM11971.1 class I SAM-dependent methyltransferase [Leptospira selangorensis]TGM15168.1 class I SAM-dependent methyltransferase [Leptospira selangorensis]